MSEKINKNDNSTAIRWKLLTGTSMLALAAYVSSTGLARAEDTGQPQVWIELGGQLNRLQGHQEAFAPTFESMRPSIFSPSEKFEGPPLYNLGEFSSLSFQPKGTDWIFSASIKYGRATKSRHVHQQTYPARGPITFYVYASLPHSSSLLHFHTYPHAARFADTHVRNSEQFTVLDFQAGKDVGLGLFGGNTDSSVNLGIRFAQFKDKSNISMRSNPDWRFQYKYFTFYGYNLQTMVQPYHSNFASITAERSFRGIGPSLSWNASTPFAGNAQSGELTFDWGVNVAALFGRQKTRIQQHRSVRYNDGGYGYHIFGPPGKGHLVTVYDTPPPAQTRSRNVTVPNIGGFAGISFKYDTAKVSFGYRADFFFNAIDGGIDARKNENRAFFGPYASISIGLGD